MKEKQQRATTSIVGMGFVILGLVLLATLVNWINAASVYNTVLPLVLIGGGLSLVSGKKAENRRVGLGLGMLLVGVIAFMVRFDLISGKLVNAVLGLVLLVSGFIVLTNIADKHATAKDKE